MEKCGACNGTGTCPKCKGEGVVMLNRTERLNYYHDNSGILRDYQGNRVDNPKTCPRCNGNCACSGCQGSGWVNDLPSSEQQQSSW